ncbi:MAG: hypothetical protein LC793_19065 [Thermomicrobia bacterium]|nr:hypothetical protein [Thermomicrobia bacterium]
MATKVILTQDVEHLGAAGTVGEEVDRRKVALDEPIRSIGEHKVTVRLVGRLVPSVTVIVTGEGGETAETAEEAAPAADAQPDQPEPPAED